MIEEIARAPVMGFIAHQMALIPILLLIVRERTPSDYWWVAGALGVSWLADTAALYANPWLPSMVYPVLQVAIIATVFLPKRHAALLTLVLVLAGLVATRWPGAFKGPDILLHSVAFLGACAAVQNVWELDDLRRVVRINFGLGYVAWLGIAAYPLISRDVTWLAYQGCRAAAIGAFCYAVLRADRRLEVVRGGLTRSAA